MNEGLGSGADSMGYPKETECIGTSITSDPTTEADNRTVRESASPHLTTDPAPSAEYLNSLGWSHLQEFRDIGTLDDLEKAIVYFSRAVTSTPDGDPELSHWQTDLGIAF
ncbi:hypothetical protein RSAG8_12110, partial [Rhizoctonia solani AG-8 WAC10335]